MKKFATMLLALLLTAALTVPAMAEQTPGDTFIYDTEGMLTDSQWAALEEEADRISWQYDCAVYIRGRHRCQGLPDRDAVQQEKFGGSLHQGISGAGL